MASLESQTTELKTNFFQKAPPAAVSVIPNWISELSQSGIADRSLQVGQTAPGFALPNAHGQMVRSTDLLAKGPIVVMFYRGEWCPFCNLGVSPCTSCSNS